MAVSRAHPRRTRSREQVLPIKSVSFRAVRQDEQDGVNVKKSIFLP